MVLTLARFTLGWPSASGQRGVDVTLSLHAPHPACHTE